METRIAEIASVTIKMKHNIAAFVVGMRDDNGALIEKILYHIDSGLIEIRTDNGSANLNIHQKFLGETPCEIKAGEITGVYQPTMTVRSSKESPVTRRPSPPPPLKRPVSKIVNPLTGHEIDYVQWKRNMERDKRNLKMQKENLEKQLDSMRAAYQAEELENRNLRHRIIEATGDLPQEPSDSRYMVAEKQHLENQLDNYRRRATELYKHNIHLMRQIKEEKQVSGVLQEDTRKRFMAWGVGLTTYQIVDLLFRFLA